MINSVMLLENPEAMLPTMKTVIQKHIIFFLPKISEKRPYSG